MNELLRSIVTKAGTLSRGLRGEKLREAVTSGDQLTQSPIFHRTRAQTQTGCYR